LTNADACVTINNENKRTFLCLPSRSITRLLSIDTNILSRTPGVKERIITRNINGNATIESNRSKGTPRSVAGGNVLSVRQEELLQKLPEFKSYVVVKKRDVSMCDLAALTAQTNVEYAMLTRRNERLIMRGNEKTVNISPEDAIMLNNKGYRWSGHTHPGTEKRHCTPSGGDIKALGMFGQKHSVIYNSMGQYVVFERKDV